MRWPLRFGGGCLVVWIGSAACGSEATPPTPPLGGSITGIVRVEGEPLPDAGVRVGRWTGGGQAEGGASVRTTRSDGSGRWRIDDLDAGSWRVVVEPPRDAPARMDPEAVRVDLTSDSAARAVDWSGTWRRDAHLEVSVLASGVGVSGARVELDGPTQGWGRSLRTVSTDDGGRAELTDLIPGRYMVSLHDPDTGEFAFGVVRQATDASVEGGSVVFQGTRILHPPEAPLNLVLTAAPWAVTLTWTDASDDETRFEIDRSPVAAPGPASGGPDPSAGSWTTRATLPAGETGWTDVDVTPGSSWRYRMRACNDAGCSAATAEAGVTTPLEPPPPPGALTAASTGPESIVLSWIDTAPDETSFQVEGAVAGGAFAPAITLAANTTVWTATGLAPATHHRFRVRACRAGDCSDWSPEAGATTASEPPPPPPPPPSGGGLGPGAPLGFRPFPPDNPWNTDISAQPVDPNSAALISACGDRNLHPDFGTVWNGAPIGIPYVVVDGSQAPVPVSFHYASESDPGPYPIPPDAPIEGGTGASGDRHVIVVDRDARVLYELFDAHPVAGGVSWQAGSGAVFDLDSNALRPAGWTSADAAGLPILPGLVRYEEAVEVGEIRHALRFTCPVTRRAYVHPARHWASSRTDPDLPPMGMRVRLRASFDISGFPAEVQVILRALKTYGMFLADNGSGWYISGVPDSRWDDGRLGTLKTIPSSAFEVVEMGTVVSGG